MDTVEHAVFECPRSEAQRVRVTTKIGEGMNVRNVIELALASKNNWRVIIEALERILRSTDRDL